MVLRQELQERLAALLPDNASCCELNDQEWLVLTPFTATEEQLDDLPGVGPATAAAIVAHRDTNGPFSTVDQLADVRGIGPAKLAAIRELVTV